jgi:hypothetical protein
VELNLQFDPTNKILLLTFGTVVTKASGMAAYAAVRTFVSEHSPCSGIVDLSAVENAELSTDAVKYFAALPTVFPAGRVLAPGLSVLDPRLPEDVVARSCLSRAWQGFERNLDEFIQANLVAA